MSENNTVRDAARDLVILCTKSETNEMWPGGPTGKDYLQGLVRVDSDGHGRGSYVEGLSSLNATLAYLGELEWEEVEVHDSIKFGACKYYQAKAPSDRPAWLNIMRLGDVPNSRLNDVCVSKGAHGDELKMLSNGEAVRTDIISCIIEDGVMSTWYPGEFTARSPEVIPEDNREWSNHWAVKLC